MHHIMYMSTAAVVVGENELKQMLVYYRGNNQQHDITGLLLYSGEHYVQLIEGKEADLRMLFTKIVKDYHHIDIIKLADGKISQRMFSDWSMGFKVVSEELFSTLSGYVNPYGHDFLHSLPEHNEDSPVEVLRQFAKRNLADISYR